MFRDPKGRGIFSAVLANLWPPGASRPLSKGTTCANVLRWPKPPTPQATTNRARCASGLYAPPKHLSSSCSVAHPIRSLALTGTTGLVVTQSYQPRGTETDGAGRHSHFWTPLPRVKSGAQASTSNGCSRDACFDRGHPFSTTTAMDLVLTQYIEGLSTSHPATRGASRQPISQRSVIVFHLPRPGHTGAPGIGNPSI